MTDLTVPKTILEQLGIAPAAVELGKEALPTFEPLGSGCRIRKGEQRHDDCYHAFIARARAQP